MLVAMPFERVKQQCVGPLQQQWSELAASDSRIANSTAAAVGFHSLPAADKTNVQNNLPLTLPSPVLLLPSICCTCLLSLNIQTRKVCQSVWPGCNWWWFKQVCGLAAVGSGSRGGMRRQRLQWNQAAKLDDSSLQQTSLHHSTQLRHQLCQSVGGY